MPLLLTDDLKKRLYAHHQYDESKFDIEATGEETYRFVPKAQPSFQPPAPDETTAELGAANLKPTGPSNLESFGRAAATSVIPTAAGVGGAMAGAGLAAMMVPEPVVSKIVGAGLLGLAGSFAGSKLQEAVVPQSIQEKLFTRPIDIQENPIPTAIGNLVPTAATLRPSLDDIKTLGQGVRNLSWLAQGSRGALTPEQVAALANAGVGLGIAGGMEAQALSEGKPFNPLESAINVLPGALFTRPTAIGTKLGFGNTEVTKAPVIPDEPAPSKPVVPQTKETPNVSTEQGVVISEGQVAPLGTIRRKGEASVVYTDKEGQKAKYVIDKGTPVGTPENPDSTQLGGDFGVAKPMRSAADSAEVFKTTDIAEQKKIDYKTALREKAKQDAEEAYQQAFEEAAQGKLLPSKVATAPEIRPTSKVQTYLGKEEPFAKANKEIAEAPKTEAEWAQEQFDRLEEQDRLKYQADQEGEALAQQEKLLADIEAEATRRQLKVRYVPEIKVAGQSKRGYYDPKTREVVISKSRATTDTPSHEVGHGYVDDLLASSNTKDHDFVLRGLEFADEQGRKFRTKKDWEALTPEERATIDERFVQLLGEEGAKQRKAELYGTKRQQFSKWLENVGSNVKNKLGIGDPTDRARSVAVSQRHDLRQLKPTEEVGQVAPAPKYQESDKSDYEQYQEVQRKFKELMSQGKGMGDPEIQALWKENEVIKNRHGGMPPKPDDQSGKKFQDDDQTILKKESLDLPRAYGHWISPEGEMLRTNSHEYGAIKIIKGLLKSGKITQKEYDKLNIPLHSTTQVESFLHNRGWLRGVHEGTKYYTEGEQLPNARQKAELKNYGIERDTDVLDFDKRGKGRGSIYEKDSIKFQAADDQTSTPEFKAWFGDSKVVNEDNGKPLRLFHGSPKEFTIFKPSKEGQLGKGIYLTPNADYANAYTKENQFGEKVSGGSIYPVYASIKNPLKITSAGQGNPASEALEKLGYTKEKADAIAEKALEDKGNLTNEIQAKAIKAGYDGIISYVHGMPYEVIAFNSKQIKSATGNSGAFDPNNPDIRYQPDSEKTTNEPLLLPSRFDKVARLGETGKEVSEKLKNFQSESEFLQGKFGNKVIAALKGYDESEIANVYKYRHAVSNGLPTDGMSLSAKEQKLKSALDKEFKAIGEDIIKSGVEVKDSEDFRKMQLKPEGYQPNIIAQKVIHAWQENTADAPKYDKLYTDHLEKQGLTAEEATAQLKEYKQAVGNAGVTPDVRFNAIRKAEGLGLPFELVEQNPALAFRRYGRRAANDVAYFKYLQNDPRMLKALGIRDQYGKDFESYPDDVKNKAKDVTWVGGSEEVKNALRSVYGIDTPMNPKGNAAIRAIANSVIQTGAAIRNIVGLPTSYASYYGVTPKTLVEAFTKMSERSTRAFESNAVRSSFKDFDAAGVIEGNPDRFVDLADKYSNFMRKYTLRDFSDKFEGELSYSLGETLATNWFAQAKAGDIKARRMLNRFGGNIEGGVKEKFLPKSEVTGEDISKVAKNFVDATRGSYGPSGLPSSAIEGGAAPMLSLSRWSIEKFNTFQKDVVRPITEHGDWMPLLKTTFAGLLTGAAIEKLNELLTQKKGADATIEETWADGDIDAITHKVIGLLQLGGFAGILSDTMKASSAWSQGKDLAFSNPISMPALTLAEELFQNSGYAFEAAKQGEDKLEVLSKFLGDLLKSTYQNVRYVSNVVNKEETERKGKFRDLRVFRELEGKPPGDASAGNPYLGMAAREFKRAEDLETAASKLPRALETAVKKSKGNYEDLVGNVEGLRKNSYQTFPADPLEASKYYQYLVRTIGVERANMRYADYLKQQAVNKEKSKMVPKLKSMFSKD